MSNGELWFWFGVVCVAGMTITRVFYYKYESKRQIELAKQGFNPTKEEQDNG